MRHLINLFVVIAVSLSALTACAGSVASPELRALGSTVTPVSVNFDELYAYANRSKTAYASEAVIRSQYPATIRINAPGKTDV